MCAVLYCSTVCVCAAVTDLHLRSLSSDGDGHSCDAIDLEPDDVLVPLGLLGVEGQCHLHGVPWAHHTGLKEHVQVGPGGRKAGNTA